MQIETSIAAPLRGPLGRDLVDLIRLSVPVIVARAGLLVMALVDTILVGRYGTSDLAELSLASSVTGALIVTGMGLLTGTLVITSNALGADDPATAGRAWRASLLYSIVLGVGFGLVCFAAEPFFQATGQSGHMAEQAGHLTRILALGLPGSLVFTTSAFFLEGLKRPVPGMLMMLAANLLNLLLVWGLVYGHLGLPPLGAEGATWATTIIRIVLAVAIVLYILNMRDAERLGIRRSLLVRWADWRQQRRVGYGGGVSIGLETGAFTALFLFAGQMGEAPLAAYSIFMNLLALIFMVSLGVATATSVRVGVAYGMTDAGGEDRAGWIGLGANTIAMAGIALLLVPLSIEIAGLYSGDAELVALSAPLIAFCAYILIVDGGQVVMLSASRGRHDVVVPTLLHGVAYIIVMAPLAWYLGVALGRGVMGLAEAVMIASVVAVGAQAGRFLLVSRKKIRRTAVPVA